MEKEYKKFAEELHEQKSFLLDKLKNVFNEYEIGTRSRANHVDIATEFDTLDYPSFSKTIKNGVSYYKYTMYRLTKNDSGTIIKKQQIAIASYTDKHLERFGDMESAKAAIRASISIFKQAKIISEAISNYEGLLDNKKHTK